MESKGVRGNHSKRNSVMLISVQVHWFHYCFDGKSVYLAILTITLNFLNDYLSLPLTGFKSSVNEGNDYRFRDLEEIIEVIWESVVFTVILSKNHMLSHNFYIV